MFVLPAYVQKLIDEKKLGRKSGDGLYKLEKLEDGTKRHLVYDIKTGALREAAKYNFPFAAKMKALFKDGNYDEAFKVLISDDSQEAQLCLGFLLRYIVYSLYIAENVGFELPVADDVMATGFTWCPPFAMMEAFARVCNLGQLMKEKLAPEVIGAIDIDAILAMNIKSKYDYRTYFKAK